MQMVVKINHYQIENSNNEKEKSKKEKEIRFYLI